LLLVLFLCVIVPRYSLTTW